MDIISVRPQSDHKLFICFEDGSEGLLDLKTVIPFEGVFSSLADQHFFSLVTVNKEVGTIQWPNGADLDPDVLHDLLVKKIPG